MSKISLKEFDTVADTYDDGLKELLGFWGGDTDRFAEYKIQLTRSIIKDNIKSIMDFGCGTGRSLWYMKKYFDIPEDALHGCDTSPKSIDVAKRVFPQAHFTVNSDIDSFKNNASSCDLIFLACVYHHIEPAYRKAWTDAMMEKLNHGGYIVVFEHNMSNPMTRNIVRKPENELDHEEYMLSHNELKSLLTEGYDDVRVFWDGYVLFSPIRFGWTTVFEKCLKWLPIGAQHCVVVKKG